METNDKQYKTLGSVGGAGSSATAGGYNQGASIAGQGGVRGDSSGSMAGSPKSGGDVRVAGHFGPTTKAANAGTGYNQGDSFAATGGSTSTGIGAKGNLSPGGDVRSGPAAAGQYNQGGTITAKVK